MTLPLAAPAVGAGLALAWARALGEFGATIMFAGNIEGRTQTLPLVVYSEFQSSLDASVAAAAVLVTAAFGVLVAVRLTRWRTGVDGRGIGLTVAAAAAETCAPGRRLADAVQHADRRRASMRYPVVRSRLSSAPTPP